MSISRYDGTPQRGFRHAPEIGPAAISLTDSIVERSNGRQDGSPLVTGANKGRGKQVAKELVDHGYIVLVGSRNLANGQRAAEEIGEGASAIELDVTNAIRSRRLRNESLPNLAASTSSSTMRQSSSQAATHRVRKSVARAPRASHRWTRFGQSSRPMSMLHIPSLSS